MDQTDPNEGEWSISFHVKGPTPLGGGGRGERDVGEVAQDLGGFYLYDSIALQSGSGSQKSEDYGKD